MRFLVARQTISSGLNWEPGVRGRTLLSTVLVASATTLAVLPLSLATAIGVTSSVCASMIIYILPAVVDLRLQLPGVLRKAASVISLLTGLFILFGGLSANLLSAQTLGRERPLEPNEGTAIG